MDKIFVLFLTFFIFFALYIDRKTYTMCELDYIKSIGGCDRNGLCGVITENGDMTVTRYPVLNKKIKYNCETKWK